MIRIKSNTIKDLDFRRKCVEGMGIIGAISLMPQSKIINATNIMTLSKRSTFSNVSIVALSKICRSNYKEKFYSNQKINTSGLKYKLGGIIFFYLTYGAYGFNNYHMNKRH